ncbi:MAG: MBL fold metallo-hydrolase [Agathobacter sp.]|nr:MBL fold metallo-hydrolase [Agathobacter sp.]
MGKMKINQYVVGPVQTNCYFVINDETKETIIIDPGECARQLAKKANEENLKPVAILLTHGHFDHVTGARELSDSFNKIPIYIHEKEKDTLSNPRINASWMCGKEMVYDADEFLKDEQEIELAGFKIRVFLTPGHTPGGCCYYFPYEDVVFTGDSLFCMSIGRTDFEKGSMSDLVRSVKEKLMVLPENTTVYPGHNEITSIENERIHNPYL